MAGIAPNSPRHAPLELDFENHDDIFSIVERLQACNLFAEPNQSTEHRQHPLFEELAPAFKAFMQRLKPLPQG